MPEPAKHRQLSWLQRMQAMRMAFEEMFFEREAFSDGDKKRAGFWKGLALAAGIGFAQIILLGFWLCMDSGPLAPDELAGLNTVSAYAQRWSDGDLFGMFKMPAAIGGVPALPAYYWSLVPAVKIFSARPDIGAILFNAFYLALLAASVFLIVRYNRVDSCGWTAAVFISCAPFALEAARHIRPDIAVAAWTAAAYACYIWSADFTGKYWTYAFGACMLLGALSGWAFLICAMPLIYALANSLFVYVSRQNSLNIAVGGVLVYGFWAWANAPSIMFSAAQLKGLAAGGQQLSAMSKVTWYFWHSADALSLAFFIVGVAAFAWMMWAMFMPYPKRGLMLQWLGVPYLLLLFVPRKELWFYAPCLAALAPAVGMMTPAKARKYVMGACAFFALVNQPGWISQHKIPFLGHKIDVFGLPPAVRPDKELKKLRETLAALAVPGKQYTNVAVTGDLTFAERLQNDRTGRNSFVFDKGLNGSIVYPDIIVDFARDLSAQPAGRLKPEWFYRAYDLKETLSINSGYSAFVYAQKQQDAPPFPPGSYSVNDLKIGSLAAEDVALTLGDWDAARHCYAWASVKAKVVFAGSTDLYGVRVDLEGFNFVPEEQDALSAVKVLKLDKAAIAEGMLTEYGAGQLAQAYWRELKNAEVKIVHGGLVLSFDYMGWDIESVFAAVRTANPARVSFKCFALKLNGRKIPSFMAQALSLDIDEAPQAGRPFALSLGDVAFESASLKIGSDAGKK